ncbi:hypothetical protein IJH97_02890 [Candidatus Saccharibacteria bacterium]|nr:hypothetical protein [Candidatus Saccharibacteria bacterium]
MKISKINLFKLVAVGSGGFLVLILSLMAVTPALLPSSSSAASSTATINVSIPDNISIELSKTNLNIDLTSATTVFGSDNTVVSVSTNNFTGYKLYLTDNDDTPVGNTALIREKTDPSEADSSIPTITMDAAHASTGYTSEEMSPISWGYSTTSATTGYKNISPKGASTEPIRSLDEAAAEDLTPVYFGVKSYPTLMPGTYKSTVIFTAVANYIPSQSNEITNISPATIPTDQSTTLTIDTNIDYSENLVDSTHPLNVSLVKVSDTSTTLSCTNVSLVENTEGGSSKLRITCTTPATGLEPDVDYTVRLVFTKLGDLAYNSNDTIAGQGFWNITYMQDMSPAICNALYTPSTAIGTTTYITDKSTYNSTVTGNNQPYIPQRQLTDKRDNKPYYVKKLADGNCWMDQNLDLDLGTPTTTANSSNTTFTLTNELTDLNTKTTWTPPYNTQLGTGTSWAQNGSDGAKSFTFNDNGTIDVKTGGTDGRYWNGASSFATTGDARNHFGNYYNWPAATAGTGTDSTATDGTNVGDSICPKGWQLPQNSGTKSFNNLIRTVYGISATNTDASVIAEPLHFIRSGVYYWNGGTLGNQGAGGYFWSATAKSVTDVYSLYFYSGNLNPLDYGHKGDGFTVRCVAR